MNLVAKEFIAAQDPADPRAGTVTICRRREQLLTRWMVNPTTLTRQHRLSSGPLHMP
jgi:hypothetical protein